MAYPRHLLILAFTIVVAPPVTSADQQDRKSYKEPGLVVETGSRMGTCDVLTFTADGKFLLAAGDDKVVRVWPVTPEGLDTKGVRTLRWSIWHEQRGNIYAMALDKAERRVAIAGKGVMTGMVAVLGLETGQVETALTNPRGNDQVIRALAFSPSGGQLAIGAEDGTVWLWNLSGADNDVQRLGITSEKSSFNPMRLVLFEGEDRLVSVARDGRVLHWNLRQPSTAPVERFRFFGDREDAPDLYRVAVTRDGKQLAAAGWPQEVEIRATDGQTAMRRIHLSDGGSVRRIARSLTFDAGGQRLAVGIRSIGPNDFFHGIDDRIVYYDLRKDPPVPSPGPVCSYHAESLAFHPDGKRLALAGGNDHDVRIWDVVSNKPVGVSVQGPGRCLWSVGLSSDKRYLGFRDERAAAPEVNARGSGTWRVFDLSWRRWQRAGGEFDPVKPVANHKGWKVSFASDNVFRWSVVGPDGRAHLLAINENAGGAPLCYTFLKSDGRLPIRLAVGQYFGAVSIFELGDREPRRSKNAAEGIRIEPSKIFTAHQGEVMAIAPSEDHKWLVTASRDQTIAALSLAEGSTGNELGATFALHDNRVFVQTVDIGSPAWEAGLNEADEIEIYAYDRSEIYNRTTHNGGPRGTPKACTDSLMHPMPGKEHYFRLKRRGQNDPVETASKLYRRPQWRFFPTRDREWVLWLWRSYYYDTSTHGDYLIGWHVNQGDRLQETPEYCSAEKLRDAYHRPKVVHDLLWTAKPDAELRSFVKIRPPRVTMENFQGDDRSRDDVVTVNVAAHSADPNHPDQHLASAELWIEDYRYAVWEAAGKTFARTVSIPRSALRSGINQLTFQCMNAAGGKDETTIKVPGAERDRLPDLYGLVIGVADYENARGPDGRAPASLRYTVRDASAIRTAWLRQSGKRYQNAEVTPLLDKDATRPAILRELARLQDRVRPDDLLVLFIGGHGYDQQAKPERGSADRFVFYCSNFDNANPEQTGLTSPVLFEALAKLRCRKLVLLDVCHSGLAANPVRGLTPGGKGPTILAACDKSEGAIEEDAIQHGLFTFALVEALDRSFDTADRDRDQKLDANELFLYAETRVPELLEKYKLAESQNPTRFPKQPDRFPLAVK